MSTEHHPRQRRLGWIAATATAILLMAPLASLPARSQPGIEPQLIIDDGVVLPTDTPTPTDSATPSPEPSDSATPTPTPEPSDSATPTPTPEPSDSVPPSPGIAAITAKYATSQDELGAPIGEIHCDLVDNGCYQSFQKGSIHWSPASGAHWTHYGIRTKWASTGWEEGILGYPTTDEICDLVDNGCYQSFQKGSIHWSPASGAHWTHYGIRTKWASTGWEEGILGYPTTDEICGLVDNGCYQSFQDGMIIWSPGTRAWPVTDPVLDYWRDTGSENGRLGYPVDDEYYDPVERFSYQEFESGAIWYDNDYVGELS